MQQDAINYCIWLSS